MKRKIKDKGTAPLFMLVYEYTNKTVKAIILQSPSFHVVNCPDSPTRNKAKNALSLTATISPVLAGAKIGKNLLGREKVYGKPIKIAF